MKLQELKNKIKTEDFDTVCLLVYESIVENKITQEQFLGLMSEIMNEFEGQIGEDVKVGVQQFVQHQLSPAGASSACNARTTSAILDPFDPLTMTTSPACTVLASMGASSAALVA